MTLARRPAAVLLAVSAVAFVVLAAVLIPWQWVPGGSVESVPPSQVFSQAQLERADSYVHLVRPLSLASYAVSLVTAAVLGFTRLGAAMVQRMPRPLRLPLGVLAVLVVGRLVTLPFSLLIYRQELHFGLTRQPLAGWFRDYGVGLLLSWAVATIVLALVVGLARRTPRLWFAWAGAAAAVLTLALSFVYPVVVEPLFNKFTPMQNGPLKQAIFKLADDEGVHIDDVLVADASRRTTTLNAYVSGFGSTRRVVVYDNLLTDLKPAEIEAVVAHELGHAKHDDVLTGTALGAVGAVVGVSLLALVLDLPGVRRRAGVDGPGDVRVVALVLALTTLGSFLASPVQNTISRAIEARADRESLLATHDKAAFESMQKQLSLTSYSDPTPPHLLYLWFASHPTTLQRIGMAEAVLGDGSAQ